MNLMHGRAESLVEKEIIILFMVFCLWLSVTLGRRISFDDTSALFGWDTVRGLY